MNQRHQQKTLISRRSALESTGAGMLALKSLLAQQSVASQPNRAANPLAVQASHHAPSAKRCIFIYLPGGPSQIDLLDPKPQVLRDNGKPLPFEKLSDFQHTPLHIQEKGFDILFAREPATCLLRNGNSASMARAESK